jgi:hypothetical protein
MHPGGSAFAPTIAHRECLVSGLARIENALRVPRQKRRDRGDGWFLGKLATRMRKRRIHSTATTREGTS